MARLVTLAVTNHHTGHTFREKIESDRVADRIAWYADRGLRYPTPDGRPGWTVKRETRAPRSV